MYLISRSEWLVDLVKAALKTNAVEHVKDSSAFLSAVLTRPYSKEACVILDLATVHDGERIITFIKSSPRTSRLPVIVLGNEEEMDSLPPELEPSINGVLTVPYTAGELAAVVASICEHRLPDVPPSAEAGQQ